MAILFDGSVELRPLFDLTPGPELSVKKEDRLILDWSCLRVWRVLRLLHHVYPIPSFALFLDLACNAMVFLESLYIVNSV